MIRTYQRNPVIDVRDIEGEIFLIHEEAGWIVHLNETASVIWRLLDKPHKPNDIISTFRFLFPEEDARYIKLSIRKVLKDMSEQKAILRRRTPN